MELDADGDGWVLLLPTSVPGGALASLRIRGEVAPPVAEGEMIDVTTCRHRGGGQTLKLSVARDILLFAAREATYANGDDCVPPGFKPQVLDLNCPPATFEGDDDDRACLTCVSSGLAFGGGRPTVTARLGEVPLDGHEYVVVAGARSRSRGPAARSPLAWTTPWCCPRPADRAPWRRCG